MPVLMDGAATVSQSWSAASWKAVRYAEASRSGSPCSPSRRRGPTAWITYLAGRLPPWVITADPVGQPPPWSSRSWRMMSGPPAWWMAPSTPPPPARALLAALTTASTSSVVMSARRRLSVPPPAVSCGASPLIGSGDGQAGVVAAEAERRRQRQADPRAATTVGNVVEVALRVGLVEVDG